MPRTDHQQHYVMMKPGQSLATCTAGDFEIRTKFNEKTLEIESAEIVLRDPPPAHKEHIASPTNQLPTVEQWEAAGSFVDALLHPTKIKSFLLAIGSKLWEGPASDEVIMFRRLCCFGELPDGIRIMPPCEALRWTEGMAFCASCGCGKYQRAQLTPKRDGDWTTSKLAYPLLKCPSRRFFPVRGRKVAITYENAPIV